MGAVDELCLFEKLGWYIQTLRGFDLLMLSFPLTHIQY